MTESLLSHKTEHVAWEQTVCFHIENQEQEQIGESNMVFGHLEGNRTAQCFKRGQTGPHTEFLLETISAKKGQTGPLILIPEVPLVNTMNVFPSDNHGVQSVLKTGARFLPSKEWEPWFQETRQSQTMDQTINLLQKSEIIEETEHVYSTYPVFLVPKDQSSPGKPGKGRVIHDLSRLTPFTKAPPFSLPSLPKVIKFIAQKEQQKPMFAIKLDLKSAFFQIPLDKRSLLRNSLPKEEFSIYKTTHGGGL